MIVELAVKHVYFSILKVDVTKKIKLYLLNNIKKYKISNQLLTRRSFELLFKLKLLIKSYYVQPFYFVPYNII